MSTKALFKPQDDFSRGILISIAAHLILICLMIFKAVFYPSEPIQLERTIRIDMVALPDKHAELPAELKAPQATPAPVPKDKPQPEEKKVELPKPEPKTPKAVSLKKTKDAESSALKRLEALKRLQNAEKQSAQATPKAAPIKGNAISPGSSLTGIAKLQHDDYIESLDEKIKQQWNLPAWLANGNFKAKVLVYIDSQGQITKMQMTESSPNPVFNEKCMEAIQKAAPFPAPPDRLANIFAVDGFEVGFPE